MARLPELLAAELAFLIAQELRVRMEDAGAASSWFVERCGHLPLGDVIGAQALFDLVALGGFIPLGFIEAMLKIKPKAQKLKPGMKLAMGLPDGKRINLTVRKDGKVAAQAGDINEIFDAADFEDSAMYGDMDSWMILAHLAGHPFAAQDRDGNLVARGDPMLLEEVGTAPMTLRRPIQQEDMNSVLLHHIDGHGAIVCHEAGIVEPVTWSLYLLLRRDGPQLEDWLDEAIASNSLPLLSHIDIALRTLTSSAVPGLGPWASRMLAEKVKWAFQHFPALH